MKKGIKLQLRFLIKSETMNPKFSRIYQPVRLFLSKTSSNKWANETCKSCCNIGQKIRENSDLYLLGLVIGSGEQSYEIGFCPFFYVEIKDSWINWYSFVLCSVMYARRIKSPP
jgi:hypothetical protein